MRDDPHDANGAAGAQTLNGALPAPVSDDGAAPRVSPTAAPSTRPVGFIRQFELVNLVKAYHPSADEDLLNRAYVFAMKAHGGQVRKSGDPYFTHPLAVAEILTNIRADPATVATGLLHDVVEDTDVTLDDIRRHFGDEIAKLVDGVTKLSKMELVEMSAAASAPGEQSPHAVQFEQLRKLVMAMADDVRILFIKLADRLHNMRTLHHVKDPAKRARVAQETFDFYAPLANRIGAHRFREELENLAFRETSPHAYEAIRKKLATLRDIVRERVEGLGVDLKDSLVAAGIENVEVQSREKKPYSIWRKMNVKNVGFEQLADIYAFRVLVETPEDCYRALGVIHGRWRMLPGEFDDYISAPKPNGYRSIHTVVMGSSRAGEDLQRIEVQIRTRAMHELAERGPAAHWQYKEQNAVGDLFSGSQFDPYAVTRRFAEMMERGDDAEEAMKHARLELFEEQVFCFTPKGQIVPLPRGATSIDFAYALHTKIGDRWVGAKINGVSMPARTALKNGDMVEILTSENAPVPEGDKLAVTGRAKAALRKRVNKLKYEEQVELGRRKAETVFAGAKLDFSPKAIKGALRALKAARIEDVLAKVGADKLTVNQLVEAAYPGASTGIEGEIRPAARKKFKAQAAIVGLPAGAKNRMAACCAPVPGERIIGIREDDGDIAVHTIACEVWARSDPPESRLIDLSWNARAEDVFGFTQVIVTVRNEIGVLSEVAAAIARYGVSIANIKMRNQKSDFVDLYIDLEVKNERQLVQMLAGLRAISSVVAAERREKLDDE